MVWSPSSDIPSFIEADKAKSAARTDVDYSNCEAHAWALAFHEANPEAGLEDLFLAVAELDDIDIPMWAAVVIENHHEDLWEGAMDLLVEVMKRNPSLKTWLAYQRTQEWLSPEQVEELMEAIISIGANTNPVLVRWAQQVLGGA